MRKALILVFLVIGFICNAQTHIEYISEKTDSMALISKEDIDVINNIFEDRVRLDSLNVLNEKIIANLEFVNKTQSIIIAHQETTIKNDEFIISELEAQNNQTIEKYSKELKKEKRKKISFQSLTGAGIIVIILLILL